MKKLFLLFSHILTKEQKKDAIEKFNICEFIYLPQKLQNIWSNIPPDKDLDFLLFKDIQEYIIKSLSKGDFILIQGDFGATLYMVNWALNQGYIPIYSTTERYYENYENEDGSITNIHRYKHVMFRKYKLEWYFCLM